MQFPLRFFPEKTHFNFMGKRWIGFTVSLLLTLLSAGLFFSEGLNLGIDFTGGILMEVRTEKPADLAALRTLLSGQDFGEVSLQNIGDERDVMVRIQSKNENQSAVVAHVKELLAQHVEGQVDYRKIDYVGPTVGRELIVAGWMSVLMSFAVIMLYVWFRFEWQYGLGAILALIHDSIMTIGFFSLTQFEFGLPAIAAVLTIVGYSINDSVVIYDRIRENMRKFKKMEIEELLNLSINETLARTVLTSSTVLMASLSLLLFGGEVIRSFSAAMAFGLVVGTYSSIYISAPTLIYLHLRDSAEPQAQPA
jgi:preprotein translocase subunit SecF